MPGSGSDKLLSARLMVERAKHHLIELDAAMGAFFGSNSYKVGTKRDPDTRELISYIASAEDVPASIPVIAGDMIQNLRNALDHLAYQLFMAGTGASGASVRHVYFPIGDDAANDQTSRA